MFHDPGWVRWPVAALATVDAGWMVFDGARALVAGDYVTADGRLGPWADVVSALGIDPRGTGMKLFFIAYGLGWLLATIAYLRYPPLGRRAMVVAAAASLWYLVAGTLSSVVQLALLGAGWLVRRQGIARLRPAGR